jgi:hypothetical protein
MIRNCVPRNRTPIPAQLETMEAVLGLLRGFFLLLNEILAVISQWRELSGEPPKALE